MSKRIVSFLPSATEILYDLGVSDLLVGVTHECDFPDDAKRKPRVIRSSFDHNKMSSNQIDKKIVELLHSGSDIYEVDDMVLSKANPDLIVAQGLCEVCSPFTKEIDRAVSILKKKPEIVILNPQNLDDILQSILEVAKYVGREREAQDMVNSLRKRIQYVKNKITGIRPKVLCIEWLDPLFTAGHWVPQMVETAGGTNGISTIGEPSRRMKIQEVAAFDPEMIILMPCGFDISRTLKEYTILASSIEWKSLQAIKNNKIFVVDANSYFSKPGPRTVAGLEILAKIIHPELFGDLQVPQDSFVQINS
ncbi:MAG: cobalamin-binding protein [Thaumarchaeota archaeon]|nr:cobalamin-binding protein [Nitrososphaerota archaeon]